MTAVYIPTATLGVSGSQTALRAAILEDEVVIVPGSIDGHSSVSNKNIDQEISPFDRIKQLEEKIGKLEKIVTVQMEK